MHFEQHELRSKRLYRDMALKVCSYRRKAFIVFPCCQGPYFDYELLGMVDAIAGFIEASKIKLFCVANGCSIGAYHSGLSNQFSSI